MPIINSPLFNSNDEELYEVLVKRQTKNMSMDTSHSV